MLLAGEGLAGMYKTTIKAKVRVVKYFKSWLPLRGVVGVWSEAPAGGRGVARGGLLPPLRNFLSF